MAGSERPEIRRDPSAATGATPTTMAMPRPTTLATERKSMPELKPGARLRSAVCSTEVMVVMAPASEVELTCGGAPMVPLGGEGPSGGSPDPALSEGTQMGKRYVDEAGELEILCTKPGPGSLALGTTPLQIKGAKPLPSSD